MNRRNFIKGMGGLAALAASGCSSGMRCFGVARRAKPGDRLNVGVIGCGGKGFVDWTCMWDHGENVVAFCDVDRREIEKSLAEVRKRGGDPAKIRTYSDWRKMLDENPRLDAVTVSTPDHTHAVAAVAAMKLGINAYVQKPLVRTLWEAEMFGKVAKSAGVITQMGNQGSAGVGHRRNVELLQQGLIGEITEIRVWTDRPIWPQGAAARKFLNGRAEVPEALDWMGWLGPAAFRPYPGDRPADYRLTCSDKWAESIRGVLHQFNWRAFADFGTGAFGDMACHTFNLPFRGAELGAVLGAECKANEGGDKVAYPDRSVVEVTFASRKSRVRAGVTLPETKLVWYDGEQRPSADLMPECLTLFKEVPKTGCLIRGTNGVMISTNDYGQEAFVALKGDRKMRSTRKHEACKALPEIIAKPTAKGDLDHVQKAEFCDAIKGVGPVHAMTGSRCFADVEHSVPMMEGMLVGCIAQQVAGPLKWDSANRVFDNAEANALVMPHVSRGYDVF